ncbi:MAG: hypothetical protein CM1200mP24_02020 [Gammaproteobacteria bacterium]|nr:MAG: hypothetical protein CM1200mP24_02020 [Gammaproteobacteria bacterium]
MDFGLPGWVAIGILDYHGLDVAPVWIVILWCALGLSINKCMRLGFTTVPF